MPNSQQVIRLATELERAVEEAKRIEDARRAARFAASSSGESSMEDQGPICEAFARIIGHYESQFNTHGTTDNLRIKEIYKLIKKMILDQLVVDLEEVLRSREQASQIRKPNPAWSSSLRGTPNEPPREIREQRPAIARNILTVADVDPAMNNWMRGAASDHPNWQQIMGKKVEDILNWLRQDRRTQAQISANNPSTPIMNKDILANEDHPYYQTVLTESRSYLCYRSTSSMVAWRVFDSASTLFNASFQNCILNDTNIDGLVLPNGSRVTFKKMLAYYYLVVNDSQQIAPADRDSIKGKFISELAEIRRAHNERNDGVSGAYAPKNALKDFFSCAAGTRGRLSQIGEDNKVAKVAGLLEDLVPKYTMQIVNEKLRARFPANTVLGNAARNHLASIREMSFHNVDDIIGNRSSAGEFSDTLLAIRTQILAAIGINTMDNRFPLARSGASANPIIVDQILVKMRTDGVVVNPWDIEKTRYIAAKARSLLLDLLVCHKTDTCNFQEIFNDPDADNSDAVGAIATNSSTIPELTYDQALNEYPTTVINREERARKDVTSNRIQRTLISNGFNCIGMDRVQVNDQEIIKLIREYISDELTVCGAYRSFNTGTATALDNFDLEGFVRDLDFLIFDIEPEVRANINFENIKEQILANRVNIMGALRNEQIVLTAATGSAHPGSSTTTPAAATPPLSSPMPGRGQVVGRMIRGEFNAHRPIGQGDSGIRYKETSSATGEGLVISEVDLSTLTADQRRVKRVAIDFNSRILHSLGRLREQYYDETANKFYLVQKLIGRTGPRGMVDVLTNKLLEEHGYNLRSRIDGAVKIAEHLEELHRLGIIHGDLHMGNIMCPAYDIFDFDRSAIYREGQPLEMIDWNNNRGQHVAPECRGANYRQNINFSIDVYALGKLFSTDERMLGFKFDDLTSTAYPAHMLQSEKEAIRQFIRSMCAVNPADRPQLDVVIRFLRALKLREESASAPQIRIENFPIQSSSPSATPTTPPAATTSPIEPRPMAQLHPAVPDVADPRGYAAGNENRLVGLLNQPLAPVNIPIAGQPSVTRLTMNTVVRLDGPYSDPRAGGMFVPTMPIIHPYEPQGDAALYNPLRGGVPDFPVTARLPIGTMNNLPTCVRALLNRNGININDLEVFFCAQNAPWQQAVNGANGQFNNPLLLRAHPWVRPNAPPADPAYDHHDNILGGVFDINGAITPEQLALFDVHTHYQDGGVRYSAADPAIPGINNLGQSQGFYSICINPATGKAALTLHWLLNQNDYDSMNRLIYFNGGLGIPTSLDSISQWARAQAGSGLNALAGGITPSTALHALYSMGEQPAGDPTANSYRLQEQLALGNQISDASHQVAQPQSTVTSLGITQPQSGGVIQPASAVLVITPGLTEFFNDIRGGDIFNDPTSLGFINPDADLATSPFYINGSGNEFRMYDRSQIEAMIPPVYSANHHDTDRLTRERQARVVRLANGELSVDGRSDWQDIQITGVLDGVQTSASNIRPARLFMDILLTVISKLRENRRSEFDRLLRNAPNTYDEINELEQAINNLMAADAGAVARREAAQNVLDAIQAGQDANAIAVRFPGITANQVRKLGAWDVMSIIRASAANPANTTSQPVTQPQSNPATETDAQMAARLRAEQEREEQERRRQLQQQAEADARAAQELAATGQLPTANNLVLEQQRADAIRVWDEYQHDLEHINRAPIRAIVRAAQIVALNNRYGGAPPPDPASLSSSNSSPNVSVTGQQQGQSEAEERLQRAAEEQRLQREAEERLRRAAEEQRRREAEEQRLQREAEERLRREADENARHAPPPNVLLSPRAQGVTQPQQLGGAAEADAIRVWNEYQRDLEHISRAPIRAIVRAAQIVALNNRYGGAPPPDPASLLPPNNGTRLSRP